MTISIPRSALGDTDEGGEPVPAAVGDQVDLTNVVGMVTGEEGDNLIVEIKSVNGAPIGGDPEAGGEAAPEEAAIMAQMQAMGPQ